MPQTPSSTSARRPTVDEWGVYDPQQAGLAALYTRLSDTPDAGSARGSRDAARSRVLHEGPAEPGTRSR